jgi:hypothetical protein
MGAMANINTGDNNTLNAQVLTNDFDTIPVTQLTPHWPSGNRTAHGTLLQENSDGTFVYQPDLGYTGYDSFIYYDTDGNGNTSNNATVNIQVVRATLAMPDGPYVPWNTDKDNPNPGGFDRPEFPHIRDYQSVRALGAADPELKQVNITLNPNNVWSSGIFYLSLTNSPTGTGRARLWTDAKKTTPLPLAGYYSQNTLPQSLYVEGMNNTSATINNGQIQIVPDVTLTLQFIVVNPLGTGNWLTLPLANLQITITPVPTILSINDPKVNPPNVGRVVFVNGVDAQHPNGVDGQQGMAMMGSNFNLGALFQGQFFKKGANGTRFLCRIWRHL